MKLDPVLSQRKRKPLTQAIFWIVLVGLIALLVLLPYLPKPDFMCGETATGTNESTWQIAGTENQTKAKILWQKSNIEGLYGDGIPNSKMAVSATQVVVGRYSINSICDTGSDVVAYKINTGEKDWRNPTPLIHWIETVDDGFLVLYDSVTATKINESGKNIWYGPQLPPRSANRLFVSHDTIYLPVGLNMTYLVSIPDSSLSILKTTSVVAAFDDLYVVRSEPNILQVFDTADIHQVMTVQLSEVLPDDQFGISPQIYVKHDNDLLLLFYGSEKTHRIEAYRVRTGQLIWTISKKFNGVPIVVGQKLIGYGMDNTLQVYNLQDGELADQISFTRIADNNEQSNNPSNSVWLAGFDQVVAILHQDIGELITLKLSASL